MGIFKNLFGGKVKQEGASDRPDLPPDVIVSTDTCRANRIPPGQHLTQKWPVLHAGGVPQIDLTTWTLDLFGLVEEPWQFTWEEFLALPRVKVYADFHCVTTWSMLDNLWEGVATREVIKYVKLRPEAKYVLVYAEEGWTTNLPLEWFLSEDALFALSRNGEPLTPEHGGPMRLIVPRLYAWKSAKWCRGVEFLAEDVPGFWEEGGYHMEGDPWKEERYRWE